MKSLYRIISFIMILCVQSFYMCAMEEDFSDAAALHQFSFLKNAASNIASKAYQKVRGYFSKPEEAPQVFQPPQEGVAVVNNVPAIPKNPAEDVQLPQVPPQAPNVDNNILNQASSVLRPNPAQPQNSAEESIAQQNAQPAPRNQEINPPQQPNNIQANNDQKPPQQPADNPSDKQPAVQEEPSSMGWFGPFAVLSPTVIICGGLAIWALYLKFNKSILEKTEEALVKFECAMLDICRSLKAEKPIISIRVIQLFEYFVPYMKNLNKEIMYELRHRVNNFAKAVGEAYGKPTHEIAAIITPSFEELNNYIEQVCLKEVKEEMANQYIHKSVIWSPFKRMYGYWSSKIAQLVDGEEE